VALKVLKRGLDTDALLRRFHTEQAALASLRHENIVGFLDAGALEDGRPYFVMEFVEGSPLTQHCSERGLGLRERLELFLEVCAAVQFAHRNLILHRDLKPSNVLVGIDGKPKLLDFGVAKILQGGTDAEATDLGLAPTPMTLRWASPEQLRGERASVATDVYGLGLLMYELASGRNAFEGNGARVRLPGSNAGLPVAPSRACGAAQRGLLRKLSGDLDAIVLCALQPEIDRRYASVDRLIADLEQYLSGGPVSVRRETAPERCLRWLRSHRVAAAMVVVLLLLTVTGFAGTWLGKLRAEQEASRGWGAHGQARRAVAFLEELLASPPPAADSPALDVWLTAAEERVETELGHYPETEALARMTLGRLCLEAGRARPAYAHFERVLELAGGERAVNDRDQARSRHGLGLALRGMDDPRAEECLREAFEAYVRLNFPDPAGRLACGLELLDVVAAEDGRLEEARALLDRLASELEAVAEDARAGAWAEKLAAIRAELAQRASD
jgi:hypothetical protein